MSPFTVAAVIVFVGVLIFVHEMGHFLVAKAFNIKVTKFSLGFGPPLVSFTWGETTYQIALIPLGGYVRMAGEHFGDDLEPEEEARSFYAAPVHQRALVAIAGPAANLAFPVLCFFAYNISEREVLPPVIGQVELGEPADIAGLQPGDRILSVDGKRTWSFDRVVQLISHRPGEELSLEIKRGEETLSFKVTPKAVSAEDPFGQPISRGMISVSNVADAPQIGVEDTSRLPSGDPLKTGDKILSINGRVIRRGDHLVPELTKVLGQTVTLKVVRSETLVAGRIVTAEPPTVLTLEVNLPDKLTSLSDIGLALGASFVRELVTGGAADQAGIRSGDRILEVDGRPVQHFWRFQTELKDAGDKPVSVKIRRNGQDLAVAISSAPVACIHVVTRKLTTAYDSGFGRGPLPEEGVECTSLVRPMAHWGASLRPELEPAKLSIDEALVDSLILTGQVIGLITTSLIKLITQEVSTDTVGGPLQFMNVAAQAAEAGMLAYLRWLAFISINLGVFNLLPVPILDGGHLLLCLIEAVKRKPLSIEARERAAMVGLALLAMLLILALRNDLRTLEIF